jgi:hypothetical protein
MTDTTEWIRIERDAALQRADYFADACLAMKAANERLRAIVDRLPKTADGHVPTEEQPLYHPKHGGGKALFTCWLDESGDVQLAVPIDECYSTSEAAKKAAEGER